MKTGRRVERYSLLPGLETLLPGELMQFLSDSRQKAMRMRSAAPKDPFSADRDWNGEKRSWCKLANAVIIQAALDWQEARQKLKRSPHDHESKVMMEETEAFFRSEYYELLTGVSGEKLLRKLREKTEGEI